MSKDIPRLVGFGLDYVLQPPTVQARLAKSFGDRLSHVSVVSVSTIEEANTFDKIFTGIPHIHHLSNVAPGDADGPHYERLAELDEYSKAMHSIWAGEDIGAWCLGPFAIPYFAPPLFDRDVARLIGERLSEVNRKSSIPVLAEIPSCTLVAGDISLGDFFHELVNQCNCGIVLDVSHVFSYSSYCGVTPEEVLESLPLENVWEAHIAGGSLDPELPYYYRDSHSEPILDEVAELLLSAVGKCPRLRAVTYEFAPILTDNQVNQELTRLEQLLDHAGFQPILEVPTPAIEQRFVSPCSN